ncbi:hypothetical protein LTR37_016273 [Vermiconidia calcicola]|uniref:Uncharacterized protein n=1 Tax=Vermiconidia calcicola TaxID=1690605 RepID=A0ACC3MN84_9PEZI|nr:hypothetical protein LTR37_016273 [Vermiconidia calcicola]
MPPGMINAAAAAIRKTGGTLQMDVNFIPIAYPAVLPPADYQKSVNKGIVALQDSIYEYIGRCPAGKIVVMGFSQGAQVVGGALAGSTFAGREPLRAQGRVAASVIYADPTYKDNRQPLDAGSGAFNNLDGTVPGDGSKYNNLNLWFGSRMRSYCEAGDQFCDRGTAANAGQIHNESPQRFERDATAFLTSLV